MVGGAREAVVGRERLRQQLFLVARRTFGAAAASTVVVEEPGVVALVPSGAADAIDEHVPIGCGGGRGPLVEILGLRTRDLLLVASESKGMSRPGPAAAVCEARRRRRLLVVSIGVGALRHLGFMVQVYGLVRRNAVPFGRETERRSAEKAPALPGAARAGVGAGRRRAVDTIPHSPRRRRGGERFLPLAVAPAENRQTGDESGTARA